MNDFTLTAPFADRAVKGPVAHIECIGPDLVGRSQRTSQILLQGGDSVVQFQLGGAEVIPGKNIEFALSVSHYQPLRPGW